MRAKLVGCMGLHAKGAFEVKIVPAESSPIGQQGTIGRMTIDKTFSGALEGSSKGEMLTGITQSTGSMAYVAIERVAGKLDGRDGTFVLMHNATMLKGDPKAGEMQVVVVPSSGTGELAGLTGKMTIVIDSAGKHTYDFEYTLP
ncbi:MAG: DUF3224 domain-containing protein [Acidobacteriota bacterium]|nr:DUF3224 domain-containing protein [Acidobacteriota bacterium]